MLNSISGYFGTHNLSVLLHLSHMTFEILLALTEKNLLCQLCLGADLDTNIELKQRDSVF